MSVTLHEGQSLALLGRNGTGKTTLISPIMGFTQHVAGTIHFRGRTISHEPPERRVAAGIGWMPRERNVFKSLPVEENLTTVARGKGWTVRRVYRLGRTERRVSRLS